MANKNLDSEWRAFKATAGSLMPLFSVPLSPELPLLPRNVEEDGLQKVNEYLTQEDESNGISDAKLEYYKNELKKLKKKRKDDHNNQQQRQQSLVINPNQPAVSDEHASGRHSDRPTSFMSPLPSTLESSGTQSQNPGPNKVTRLQPSPGTNGGLSPHCLQPSPHTTPPHSRRKHLDNPRKRKRRGHGRTDNQLMSQETPSIIERDRNRKNVDKNGHNRKTSLMSAVQLKKCCVRLVTVHGRPFTMMNDSAFQEILTPLIETMPVIDRFVVNHENICELAVKESKLIKDKISDELKGKLISLKVDLCTKGTRPFIAIHVQFISCGALQMRTLLVKEMMVCLTGENLKKEICKTLADYNIPVEYVYTLTSDNGANMLNAATLLGERQDSVAADIYAVSDPEPWECDCYLESKLFQCQCIRCPAHLLHLAVEAAVTSSQETLSVIESFRNLAHQLRTLNARKQLALEKLQLPSTDVAMRWHTIHKMLLSVCQFKEFVSNEYVGDNGADLLSEQWSKLDDILNAFNLIKVVTKRLQEEQLLLGDFLQIWMNCRSDLHKLKSPLADAIVINMDEQVKATSYKTEIQGGQLNLPPLFENPVFLAAIFLDPRFFSFLSEEQVVIAKSHLQNLWERMERLEKGLLLGEDAAADINKNDSTKNEDEDEFDTLLKKKDKARTSMSTKLSISSMLDTYYAGAKMLHSKTDVLMYWCERRLANPKLYALSCVALSVPATQVSVKRLFSSVRFILNPVRLEISPSIIEDLLIIRNNHMLMEESLHSAISSRA